MDASSHHIRDIQRKNGKIIIRTMLEIEKATFESIVEKLCSDYNVSGECCFFPLAEGNVSNGNYFRLFSRRNPSKMLWEASCALDSIWAFSILQMAKLL